MGLPIPLCQFTSGNNVTNGTGRPVPYKIKRYPRPNNENPQKPFKYKNQIRKGEI